MISSLNSATAAAVNALAQDFNARMHQAAANMSAIQRQTSNMLVTQCHNINNGTTTITTAGNVTSNNNLFNLMQVN